VLQLGNRVGRFCQSPPFLEVGGDRLNPLFAFGFRDSVSWQWCGLFLRDSVSGQWSLPSKFIGFGASLLQSFGSIGHVDESRLSGDSEVRLQVGLNRSSIFIVSRGNREIGPSLPRVFCPDRSVTEKTGSGNSMHNRAFGCGAGYTPGMVSIGLVRGHTFFALAEVAVRSEVPPSETTEETHPIGSAENTLSRVPLTSDELQSPISCRNSSASESVASD
jgi:hypothetical protein